MANQNLNQAVYGAVYLALYEVENHAMFWEVTRAKGLAVYMVVYQASTRVVNVVYGAVILAVNWAVGGAVHPEESPHPGLARYLEVVA